MAPSSRSDEDFEASGPARCHGHTRRSFRYKSISARRREGHYHDRSSRLLEQVVAEIMEQAVQGSGRPLVANHDPVGFFPPCVLEQSVDGLVIGDRRSIRHARLSKRLAPDLKSPVPLLLAILWPPNVPSPVAADTVAWVRSDVPVACNATTPPSFATAAAAQRRAAVAAGDRSTPTRIRPNSIMRFSFSSVQSSNRAFVTT